MNVILGVPVFLPILAGLALLFINFKDKEDIHAYTFIILIISLIATIISSFVLMSNELIVFELPMKLTFTLYTDAVAAFFSTIFAVIWILVAIYGFEYLKHAGSEKRFYAFYIMTLGCIIGVAYADNPFTFYMCFEAMTLCSFPLVLHSQTQTSIKAAKKYAYYSMFGAFLGLIGIFYFYSWDTIALKSFVSGGVLPNELGGSAPLIYLITFIAILGFSCKSGMFPLHAWLPVAHPEAPAPASSVLSGIITKTGIIAIIRIVFFVVGADILRGSWVQKTVLLLSIMTIFMGSMMAYLEKNLKRRLAYSSVSQISYVIFGIMLLSNMGAMGALLQVAFHALAKNVLFLCAGAIIYKTGKEECSQLNGIGKAMPKTFACFTIASLSLVGVPLTGGFVSKYYLALSALSSDLKIIGFVGICVLMVSALLTGGYLLTISAKALFTVSNDEITENCEPNKKMLVPIAILSALIIIFGVFPQPLITLAQAVVQSFGL